MSENNHFKLKSANDDFTTRQKNVFDQLLLLETDRKKSLGDIQMEVNADESNIATLNPKIQRAITKKLRGKESIFKKPQNPVPKNYINKIPDFKKHPHKWTKYTLDDVKDEDMSDKSNTKTALSFLEELKERKHSYPNSDIEEIDLSRKVIFKTKKQYDDLNPKNDTESLKPSFKSSKVIMPEYIVGQRVKIGKKRKDIIKGKELKLDHLYED